VLDLRDNVGGVVLSGYQVRSLAQLRVSSVLKKAVAKGERDAGIVSVSAGSNCGCSLHG